VKGREGKIVLFHETVGGAESWSNRGAKMEKGHGRCTQKKKKKPVEGELNPPTLKRAPGEFPTKKKGEKTTEKRVGRKRGGLEGG